MKDKISRRTIRPPCPTGTTPILEKSAERLLQRRIYLKKSDYRKRIILEKAVSALRCKGRTASIAFVYTLLIFQQKSECRQTPVCRIRHLS